MNYTPFAGYWFYGEGLLTDAQTVAYFCSYGLLDEAPESGTGLIARTWRKLKLGLGL